MMRIVSGDNAPKPSPSADDEELAAGTQSSRRRSARIVLRIPLLINSVDSNGETEWEHVETVMVSLHGGMLRARQNFQVGDTLDIRVRNKDRSARARVVWASSEITPSGIELGFEILDQDTFWDINFPADRWSERPLSDEGKS
jgi:PilZ domain